MNAILVIILTGFAVLGAYFLAQLLSGEGGAGNFHGAAVFVTAKPVTTAQAMDLALALQDFAPRCELLCTLAEGEGPLPVAGGRFAGITFLPPEELAAETARRLRLQQPQNTL